MLTQELIAKFQAADGIRIGVDRMVIGYTLGPMQLAAKKAHKDSPLVQEQYSNAYISMMNEMQDTIRTVTEYKELPGKYQTRYVVRSTLSGSRLCTVSFGFGKSTYTNVEWNPSKLSHADWLELEALFDVLFELGYGGLFQNGVVSHAEFCVDVSGAKNSDFVLVNQGRHQKTIFNGTTYYGRRTSPLVCTMYDKGAQLKIDDDLLRVEVRINRRDIWFQDLINVGIQNPFESIFVVPVDALQIISNDYNKPTLANNIKEFGVSGAVKNNAARKAILAKLKVHTVSWWQPDMFWKTHQQLLKEFRPPFVGGCNI